ncbi:MAG: alpha/beta hydrolase [Microbacteriaceae bacterium]|nr:alpha/beta hydrolase [Microbacteriaceae bacterium]MCL2794891.1 alpha/beta hydrolase [Microbacteriaceae bacterium]
MTLTHSADGTPVAFEAVGDGPTVVIVNGAFSVARDAHELAAALAAAGFRAVAYDRRARGGSGDTTPFRPEREVDDLSAVVSAVGGAAATLGHSSGAVLALFAASLGVPTGHLFLSEPPFRCGEDEPPVDLVDRLQALIDAGRPEDAVTTFQLEAIGLPREMVEQFAASPAFAPLVALAQSTVYDAWLTRDVSTPTAAMTAPPVPVSVLSGVETFPFLRASAERLAALIPGAEFVSVPESVGHRVDPAATTRLVVDRLG